ncbi:MAG: BlaI/MecI/CopY family transcriptional regulator [Candidatus Eremiobacteraeota bacterium]|nr:BlaI/MecI/CopY family transcriptional regulator [Candidatus Eremiobacteraeota bacterium]
MDEHLVLGDRELDVMGVLWTLGSGTVAEVRVRLPADLAYTTVLTILRNLERKGMVAHDVEGQAHRYRPQVARAAARRSALARLVDTLFHGAPEQLLTHLVEERALTADDLRRLRAQIEALERDAHAAERDAAGPYAPTLLEEAP